MKFRKKPVVIDATQWDSESPECVDQSTGEIKLDGVEYHPIESKPVVRTLEGIMFVTQGDWIITGVKGEHYPCKPDIFEATYERVE